MGSQLFIQASIQELQKGKILILEKVFFERHIACSNWYSFDPCLNGWEFNCQCGF